MARNVLSLSPSYQRDALVETRKRDEVLVLCLTAEYLFSDVDIEATLSQMRKRGYIGTLTKNIVSERRMVHRNVYRYFTDAEFRGKADAALEKRGTDVHGGHGRLFGVACLKKDRPEWQTWEDVQRALDEALPEMSSADTACAVPSEAAEQGPSAVEASVPTGEAQERVALDDDGTTAFDALLTQVAETRATIEYVEVEIRALIARECAQAASDRRTIAALQSENARLRAANAELLRKGVIVGRDVADLGKRSKEMAYQLVVATWELPELTDISLGGWQKKMRILYSQERDAFLERLGGKTYNSSEKQQVAKAMRFLAQNPRHPSLQTETFRRALPGIPSDVEDFSYSRASESVRFGWKQMKDTVRVFNIYKHRSGAGTSLPDIR